MKHIDLFSGIGGAALAVDTVWQNAEHVFCDIDPFCRAILKKHWPQATIHDDIKTFDGTKYKGAYLLTGGFPCQPASAAGKRRGTADDRWLWPAMLAVIRAAKPKWIIGENVAGLLTIEQGVVFESVCADLEKEGYEVQPFIIPACAVGAPHRRDRVWIIAHANGRADGGGAGEDEGKGKGKGISERDSMGKSREPSSVRLSGDASSNRRARGREAASYEKGYATRSGESGKLEGRLERPDSLRPIADSTRKQAYAAEQRGLYSEPRMSNTTIRDASDSKSERCKVAGLTRRRGIGFTEQDKVDWNNWPAVAAELCTLDDGLPGGLARPRGWRNAALKGAGNAWVPQVAIEIFKAIKAVDDLSTSKA
jgi:DNA (cytosine-5)-methyltransferase 1